MRDHTCLMPPQDCSRSVATERLPAHDPATTQHPADAIENLLRFAHAAIDDVCDLPQASLRTLRWGNPSSFLNNAPDLFG